MSSPGKPDRVAPGRDQRLSEALIERVLSKLGLSEPPDVDRSGLAELYEAWCRRVPFDNIRKLIHLREEHSGALPGDDATDFFDAWLSHGAGGTCWAGNGALQALLSSLGFAARRGYGTMMVAPDIPPNHGTVVVNIDGWDALTDASILFGEPLPLRDGATIDHGAWGVRLLEDESGRLRVKWRPFHMELDCRIDSTDAGRGDFQRFHELTRAWSPFNYALSARLIVDDSVIGASFGQLATIDSRSSLELVEHPTHDERMALLVERIGISEELAARLPEDQPMPSSSRGSAPDSSSRGE